MGQRARMANFEIKVNVNDCNEEGMIATTMEMSVKF